MALLPRASQVLVDLLGPTDIQDKRLLLRIVCYFISTTSLQILVRPINITCTDCLSQGEIGDVGIIGLPGDPGPQVLLQIIDHHFVYLHRLLIYACYTLICVNSYLG